MASAASPSSLNNSQTLEFTVSLAIDGEDKELSLTEIAGLFTRQCSASGTFSNKREDIDDSQDLSRKKKKKKAKTTKKSKQEARILTGNETVTTNTTSFEDVGEINTYEEENLTSDSKIESSDLPSHSLFYCLKMPKHKSSSPAVERHAVRELRDKLAAVRRKIRNTQPLPEWFRRQTNAERPKTMSAQQASTSEEMQRKEMPIPKQLSAMVARAMQLTARLPRPAYHQNVAGIFCWIMKDAEPQDRDVEIAPSIVKCMYFCAASLRNKILECGSDARKQIGRLLTSEEIDLKKIQSYQGTVHDYIKSGQEIRDFFRTFIEYDLKRKKSETESALRDSVDKTSKIYGDEDDVKEK